MHSATSQLVASVAQTHNATGVRFDTDSIMIGVDTHASCTMSPLKDSFEDLKPINTICGGFGDKPGEGEAVEGIGTFVFAIDDDDGRFHTIKVPHSLYIPTMRHTLLCPQHWAQVADDHSPAQRGTGYEGDDKDLILFWDQRQFRHTVQYNPQTNTPCF